MMAEIIAVPTARAPRDPVDERIRQIIDERVDGPVEHRRGQQLAGRKRNPWRRPCYTVSRAVTTAGRLHRGEPINDLIDGIERLRKGAAAARHLAEKLERIADQHSARQS